MDIPLCQSEHKPQLLLNDPAAISLYHTAPEQFAGALAPNAELCDAWAEELAPLPDMMKSIGKDEHGNDIKVRDSEGIQLANAKIDEIRNGFSEWLEEQSPQFKERLTTMYNRKFNCFVRPKYDGSHQTFPDLNLKGLASRQSI